jgi:hypothetical protein
MIHLQALEAAAAAPLPGGELVARIAGLRRALRLLEPSGCGPSCDGEEFAAVEFASEPVRRCFDARSERVIGAAAAGLEAVVGVRASGNEANPAAVGRVAETIREGLWDLSRLVLR